MSRGSDWMRLWALTFAVTVACAVGMAAFFAPGAKAVPAASDFFGISSYGQLNGEAEAEEIQRLGIRNVRNNIGWGAVVAPTAQCGDPAGPPNWAPMDHIFEVAARHNITIIPDLYGNRRPCDEHKFPVVGTSMYNEYVGRGSGRSSPGGFVWEVVQRYGVGGRFWEQHPELPAHPPTVWEVWNEPNLPENNPTPSVSPQLYARFLIDVSATIRAAQAAQANFHGARVLLGGLYSGGGVSVGNYFHQIYSAPTGYTPAQFHNSFDGLSYHPYAISGSAQQGTLAFGTPTDAVNMLQDARNVLNQARSALNGGSDSGKTLWVTEVGWPTEFVPFGGITPQIQADYLVQTLNWMYVNAAALKIEYAAPFVYQNLSQPGCITAGCWPFFTGLKRADGTERPSFCAYMGLIGVNTCAPSGVVAMPPAAYTDAKGTEHVFVTTGGGINHYARGAGATAWGGEIVVTGGFTSAPTAFTDSNGTEHVFVATGGGINHYARGAGAIAWGGEIVALSPGFSRPTAFVDPKGNEHVFVATGGGINHYVRTPGGNWNGEIVAASPGFSQPTAFVDPKGNEHVFVATGGGINHYARGAGATAWGGEIVATFAGFSAPTAYTDAKGTEHVSAATGGGINHYARGAGAIPWGGEIVALSPGFSQPTAYTDVKGTEHVFVTTGGGINHYARGAGAIPWGGEIIVTGAFTSLPVAYTDPKGTEHAFVRTGGGVNHYLRSPGGNWGGEIVAAFPP